MTRAARPSPYGHDRRTGPRPGRHRHGTALRLPSAAGPGRPPRSGAGREPGPNTLGRACRRSRQDTSPASWARTTVQQPSCGWSITATGARVRHWATSCLPSTLDSARKRSAKPPETEETDSARPTAAQLLGAEGRWPQARRLRAARISPCGASHACGRPGLLRGDRKVCHGRRKVPDRSLLSQGCGHPAWGKQGLSQGAKDQTGNGRQRAQRDCTCRQGQGGSKAAKREREGIRPLRRRSRTAGALGDR